jgi:uncharacterized protein
LYPGYEKFDVEIIGETIINPSEDTSKITKCLLNSVNCSDVEIMQNRYARIKGKGILCLHHIRVGVRSRYSTAVLRRLLEYNRSGDTTWFLLNKQAAYCNIISLVEDPEESTLGPIRITIKTKKIDEVISWIVDKDKDRHPN